MPSHKVTPNPDGESPVTIYDIAREAGVSTKTVSCVLNNRSGISRETRERIFEIMQRLNYRPRAGTRAARGNTVGCIGATVSAPLDVIPINQAFMLWMIYEMFRVFGRYGEYLCFDFNPYGKGMNRDYARGVWQQLYKACIIAGPLAVDDFAIHRVHLSGVPYMALGRLDDLPECSSATVDYEQGAYISTKFLLDRGHKYIAMVRAFSGFHPGIERRRGYLRALQEAGLPIKEELIRDFMFRSHNIVNIVHRLLAERQVTALVDCTGMEDATSIREGARRAGRTPGKDFEIVSWTYSHDCVVLPEAAAHVWLPVREAAAEGLEELAQWVKGEREGPIRILYQPILDSGTAGKPELPKPRRLFEMLD